MLTLLVGDGKSNQDWRTIHAYSLAEAKKGAGWDRGGISRLWLPDEKLSTG